MTQTARRIAADLADQHDRRAAFSPIPKESLGDISVAYAVQDALLSLWTPRFGDIAGWKVGLTTARMQAMCGVNQPIAGAILAQRVHDSPATIRAGAFVHLGLETELSFRIAAAPKPGAEVTAANVREVVDLVAASFELIEDRAADYSRLDAGSMIADNSWNGGIVLAEPVRVSEIPDFKGIRGVLTVNGVPVDSGLSEDVGGDPLEIVAWLIRCLSDRGRRPEPGQWIMTGSVVPTKFPVLGDVCSLTFDGFPPVEMTVV